MLVFKHFYFFLSLLSVCVRCIGQSGDNLENNRVISQQGLSKIEKNMNSINENLEKKTIKSLARFQKQESKLKDKLALKDTLAAKNLFNGNDPYQLFIGKIKTGLASKDPNEYMAELDSLKT